MGRVAISVHHRRHRGQWAALCPEARATERRHVLDLLECRSGDTVCDVLAGGGYLAVGLARVVGAAGTVLCIDCYVEYALL